MKLIRVGGITLRDYGPREDFAADVAAGLAASPRSIPSKYLYDAAGSALYEQICGLPEYYLTRTELSILRAHLPEMAALLGPRCAVVEPGAGSGLKTRMLLEQLDDPVAFVPVDISRELLLSTARAIQRQFPDIEVLPVCADYHDGWKLPPLRRKAERSVAFFPGSTIGNMEPDEARAFMRRMAEVCGAGCGMLIGVDLRKDPEVIARAYDDGAGVTRRFNLNLLARLNRELGAQIPEGALTHVSLYNEAAGRNESYLGATMPLELKLDSQTVEIASGERILVEHSYKYSLEGFAALAASAGLWVAQVWMDVEQWFSVQYLVSA